MNFTLQELKQSRELINKVIRNDSLTHFELAVLGRFVEALDRGALHLSGTPVQQPQQEGPHVLVLSDRDDELGSKQQQPAPTNLKQWNEACQPEIERQANKYGLDINKPADLETAIGLAERENPNLSMEHFYAEQKRRQQRG